MRCRACRHRPSADNLDVPGVMGVTLVAGPLYLLVDILYALFDPRIRYA